MIRLLTAEDLGLRQKLNRLVFRIPGQKHFYRKAFKMPGITSGFQKMKRER